MPTGRAGAASIPPDVVDYLLHVGQLCRIQPSNLKVESVLLPQQEIRADRKETGNPHQHRQEYLWWHFCPADAVP